MRRQGSGRQRRFRIPYQIRAPQEPHEPLADAAITDLWAGFVRDCCTKQEVYGVKFPPLDPGQDPFATKALLVSTTLLINTLFHEHD